MAVTRSRDLCAYVGAIVGNTRSCSLVHVSGPRSPRRRERCRNRRFTFRIIGSATKCPELSLSRRLSLDPGFEKSLIQAGAQS